MPRSKTATPTIFGIGNGHPAPHRPGAPKPSPRSLAEWAAARALTARYAGGSVIAVTHVTPVKALVAHALGAPPAALFRMELSAAGFSRIAYTGEEASVKLVNDTSHLY